MTLQKKSFKFYFIFLVLSFFSFNQLQAQSELDDFLDKFPVLPNKVTDKELRAKIETAPNIVDSYGRITKERVNSDLKYIPIGKIETKKTVILIYAEIAFLNPRIKKEYRKINVYAIALDNKKGDVIEGSKLNYLLMSGGFEKTKEMNIADIDYDGKKVTFTNVSKKNGITEKTDIVTYTVGKKMLEFDSKN
ncbi:hypothetical protein Fleli_3677 [Bernardetia litoralis DSM 6794]|uniref:Secreted protein n=1 Tax=Bernardetia litoralis (strain ATCC 23117 / DSM 6794 / NBRC 15988 / NCIMB 1366 / Fx l1 / Sio-4) TaxID=880071 RepID=I4APV6_BERLS|nr:hypothetical protein [Bernardetia litoralis]AFM05991.1 hypothetical protein Fleli_3677 [Bernardetia litoralis DSM 6794]